MSDKILFISVPNSNIGDYITTFPVVNHIMKSKHTEYDRFILQSNYYDFDNDITDMLNFDHTITISDFSCREQEDDATDNTVTIIPAYRFAYKFHLVDLAFEGIGRRREDVPIEDKNYIKYSGQRPNTSINIGGDYVIIHATFNDYRRSISIENMYKIVKFVDSLGLIPVLVGSKYNSMTGPGNSTYKKIDHPYKIYDLKKIKCINLISKTTLKELLWLLSNAKCVIGPDSGILHMAGLTSVPILGIYTATEPYSKMPIRNNEIGYNCKYVSTDVSCKWCINNDDFSTTIKKCDVPERPKCVNSIKSEDIINKLKEIL